jgi:hypothetical protein
VTDARLELLSRLGFRFGTNGPHAARTMMLDDVTRLFDHLPPEAVRGDYAREAVSQNCLGKPTKKARELSLRHLMALYGLDPSLAVFRAFRKLWAADPLGRPLLALCVAIARDPLLHSSIPFIVSKRPGEKVTREEIERVLADAFPERFSPASLKSFAQNVNGTWTQAGYLRGHSQKTRVDPVVTPGVAALSLFLGYLEGLTGQRLFSSRWTKLLSIPSDKLDELTTASAHRGMLVFMNSGGIREVRFPGYLTPEEDDWRRDAMGEAASV